MKPKSAFRLARTGSRAAYLLAVSIAALLSAGPALAEEINGINFIQPQAVTAVGTYTTPGVQGKSGPLTAMIDGTGITLGSGYCSTADTDEFAAFSDNKDFAIIFDLGAEYDLSSVHVWNGNYGIDIDKAGPVRDVWISTSKTLTTTTNGSGWAVFSAPVDAPAKYTLDNNQNAARQGVPTYTGKDYSLATTGTVRYVMFNFHGAGANSYYTSRNDTNSLSLSEVRFQVKTAPPAVWSAAAANTWGTAGNWSGAVVPGAADTVLFNGTDTYAPLGAIAMAVPQTVLNLTIDSASAPAYTLGTLGGNALTLASGGTLQTTTSVTTAQTINAPLVIEGWDTVASNATSSAATLTLGGAVRGGASATGDIVLTLAGSNTGNNRVSGDISDGLATPLALINTGSWTLSGTNTYSGTTTVGAGTLWATKVASLPGLSTLGKISVASGATLAVKAGGVGEFGSVDLGDLVSNGAFSTGAILALDTSSGDFTASAKLYKPGLGLTKLGANKLTLTGSGNSLTGPLTISGGSVEIAGSGPYGNGSAYINSGSLLKYASTSDVSLILSGGGDFIKDGSSKVAMNSYTGFTGSIMVKGGTLDAGDNQSGRDITTHNLTLDGGALSWTWGNATFASPFTVGTAGTTLINNAGGGNFSSTGPILFAGTGDRTLTFAGNSGGAIFTPVLNDPTAGKTSLRTTGGTWTLNGSNTFTGTTTISGGQLTLGKVQALNGGIAYLTPANITVASGATLALPLGLAASGYFGVTEIQTALDAAHLGASTPTTGILPGGKLAFDTATAPLALAPDIALTTRPTFTYNAVLADPGPSSKFNLLKTGWGTLVLDQANTFSGTIDIQGPIGGGPGYSNSQQHSNLQVGNANALGTGTVAFSTNGDQRRVTLDLHGFSVTVTGLSSPAGNGGGGYGFGNFVANWANDGSTSVLTVNNAVDNVYEGQLMNGYGNGVLALTKEGGGMLTLTNGGSNFSGQLTIKNGTLATGAISNISTDSALGNSALAVIMGESGSTGTLRYTGGSTTSNKPFTIADGGTAGFLIDDSSTNTQVLTLSGVIGGSGDLLKSGPDTLVLSGTNTYTGTTTVKGGMLSLAGTSATTGATTVNTGTLQLDYGTQDNSKLANGAVLTLTSGTLNLSGGSHTEVVGSTTLDAGISAITRGSGTAVLRMNEFTRNAKGIITFGAAGIAETLTLNTHGILGTYATVLDDWAASLAAQTPATTIWDSTNNTIYLVGRANGNSVTFSGDIPGGLTAGTLYYVVNASGTDVQLAVTPGGAPLDITSDGTTATAKTSGAINAYTGYTDIPVLGSTLADGPTSNVRIAAGGSGSSIVLGAATTTVYTLLQSAATAATVNTAGKTLRTNAIMLGSGAQSLTFGINAGDGFLQPATAGGELALINNSASVFLTVNARIADNTSASTLIKSGTGNVVLAAANTFSGGIDLVAGTLTLANPGSTPGASALGTGPLTISAGATLDSFSPAAYTTHNAIVINGDFTYGGTVGLDLGTSNVSLGTAPGTSRTISTYAFATTGGSSLMLGGVISEGSSANSLNKAGLGFLTLTGTNTYTGLTTISAGTLAANNIVVSGGGSSLGNATSPVILGDAGNRGALSYIGGATNFTRGFSISNGGGTLTNAGSGLLTVSGGIAINVDANFTVGGANQDIDISSIISGSNSSLTKSGYDLVTLSGANTYTGTTTVGGGGVSVINTGTFSTGGGTLRVTGSLNGSSGTVLNFTGSGTFTVSEASGVSQGMGTLSFSGGEGKVQSINNGGNSLLTFSSFNTARNVGSAGNFVVTNGTNGTDNAIILGGVPAGFINRGFFFGGDSYAYMNSTGGYVRGINYGVDALTATTAGGTSAASIDHLQVTGNITAEASGAIFKTLLFNGAPNFTLAPGAVLGGVLQNGFGIIKTGGGTTTMSGGVFLAPYGSGGDSGDNTADIILRVAGVTDTLVINTPLRRQATGTNIINNLAKQGAGNLILGGDNNLFGTLSVDGGGTVTLAGKNVFGSTIPLWYNSVSVGTNSAGNTLNVSGVGTLTTPTNNNLYIGAGSFGNNTLDVSAPAGGASPSLKIYTLLVGGYSSNNNLTMRNGAQLRLQLGGNSAWNVGFGAGADFNSFVITGAGTMVTRNAAQGSPLTIGYGGSNNSLTLSAGAMLYTKRFVVGRGTGSNNNSATFTGVGTFFDNTYNQLEFAVGGSTSSLVGATNASGNSFTTADQAVVLLDNSGGQTSRPWTIGGTNGCNNNSVVITGLGSQMRINHLQPWAIGGNIQSNIVTDTYAKGNHLDILSGGSLTYTTGTPSGTSIYLMGVDSAFNLGNGTGISTARIGATSSFVAGVYLKNPDAKLNFNSGRLIAGSPGALVSGLGTVVLNGPAYITTAQADSSISSVISGSGSLIKEGSGLLTLSGANSYSGSTYVNQGTLTLDYTVAESKLADASSLVLGGGTLDLKSAAGLYIESIAATTLNAGLSNITRTGGNSVLRLNAITPGVGLVNFGAASIASTSSGIDDNGLFGAWATVGGANWAWTDGIEDAVGSGNFRILAFPDAGYTNINALGGTLSGDLFTNVRINAAGTGSNMALASGTTTVNTLLQNTGTATIIAFAAGNVLATNGIMIASGMEAVTLGTSTTIGSLKAATAGANLVLNNNNATKLLTVNTPIVANGASGLATAGPVTLNGVNTYSGPTGVGGALTLGGAGQLGSGNYAGAVSIATGGVFTMGSSATQILSGVISGDGAFSQLGTGTTTLSGVNTYTGATTVTAGILAAGNELALGPAATATLVFGVASTGTVRLNGNNLTVTRLNTDANIGTPIIESGSATAGTDTLTLNAIPIATNSTTNVTGVLGNNSNTYAGVLRNGSTRLLALVKNGTGALKLTGTSTYSGGTTVNGGVLTLGNKSGLGTGSVTLASTSLFQQSDFDGSVVAGAVANPIILGGGDALSEGEVTFNIAGATVSGVTYKSIWLTGDISGTGRLRVISDVTGGTLTLSGAKTFTGGILQSSGSIALAGTATSPFTGGLADQYPSIQIDNIASLGTGVFRAQLSTTLATSTTLGVLRPIANLSAGTGVANAIDISTNARLVVNADGTNHLKLSGIMTGDGRLVKTGTATLTLTGTNTYSGGTIVNVGTLTGTGASPLGAMMGTLAVNNAGTILNLSSTAATYTGSLSGTGTPTINNGGQLFSVDQTTTATYAGVIAGSGGFTLGRLSTAVLTLSGVNTYQGGTTVEGGTLTGTGTAPLGAATGPLTVNNPNSGGPGTAVVLNLSSTAATTTGFLSGTIATPASGTNTATIDNKGKLLTVNQTSAGTYAGVITGAGGLTLGSLSSNTLTLSGVNAYAGATVVSAGKLSVSGTGTINASSGISVGAASFSYSSATALTKAVTFTSTGGTLGGTGSIVPAVTVTSGNTLSPGNSAGVLNFGSGLTLAAGSIFNWENTTLNSLGSAGINWDVASVASGTTTISSTPGTGAKLNLKFTDAGTSFSSSFWDANRTWGFITGGVSGSNLFDASNIAVFINGAQQGANNTITGQGTFTTAVTGTNLQLQWSALISGNNSKLWVGGTEPGTSLLATTVTQAFGRVMLSSTQAATVTLHSSGSDAATTSANVSASGDASTATASGLIGALTLSGIQASLTTTTTGEKSGTLTLDNQAVGSAAASQGSDNGNASVTVTGSVLANRILTAAALGSLGLQHVGATYAGPSTTTVSTASGTAGGDDHATRVTLGGGTDGTLTVAGSATAFNSASQTEARAVTGTLATAGAISGSISLATAVAGTESAIGTASQTTTVTYSASVFNGSGSWTLAGNGNWGTHANWADSNGIQAAPGTFAGFGDVDTATFGNTSGSVSVNLDTAPSVHVLNFNGTGNYTLAGSNTLTLAGAAAAINVSSGTQAINAALTLANPVTITVTGGSLAIGGNISAAGSQTLTKSGGGLLTLSGTNGYNGDTHVGSGSLLIDGANTGSGTLSVDSSASLGGSGSIAGAVNVSGVLSPGGALVQSLASGTLTLLSGSSFTYQAQDGSATGADVMLVNGALSLAAPTLDLTGLNGVWAAGSRLTLLSYTGSLSGTFSGYADDTSYLFGTNAWVFNYNAPLAAMGTNFAAEVPLSGASLVTVTLDAYKTWAAQNNISGAAAAFDADPNKDGVSNGLAWMLGATDPNANNNALLPKPSASASGGLTLTFKRLEASIGTTTLVLQYATSLAAGGNWTDVPITQAGGSYGGVVVTVNEGSTPDSVSVNIPAIKAVGGKLFSRLKAVQP